MPGDLQSLSVPLWIMAAVSVLQALLLIGIGVAGYLAYSRVMTLVNDLDLRVVDASGATVLPYVLNKDSVDTPATRGVNTVDNVEVVEIANATPGNYRVLVNGTRIASTTPQQFVVVANAR